MIYNLRILAAGFGSGIELTGTEYASLVSAIQRIYLATGVEEKLDLLLENYLEYESELLQLGLQSCLFTSIDDHRVFREAQLINRRIVNLLTAARMYIDQVKHSLARYFDPDPAPDIAALFSAEYDQHLEYRIAEALRNHTQHRALPVHTVLAFREWEKKHTAEQRLRFTVIPSVSLEELVDEGEFKASVLAELEQSGKKFFPLTPILRRYVESLASVHGKVRLLLSDRTDLDHQTLVAALDRARSELNEKLTGLAVTSGIDPEHPSERHYISERSWARRSTLIRKNSQLLNLSLCYVSAEHPGDAA